MSGRQWILWLLGASLLIVSGTALSQDANQNRTLVINANPRKYPLYK
jgi:hypothetical protein